MPVSVRIGTGDLEELQVGPLIDRYTGDFVTGLTNVKAKIRRLSDDKAFDWSDSTFKDSGSVTTLAKVMTEVDSTNFPGEYQTDFNTGAITNPNTDDIYEVTVIEDGTSTVVNLPQAGEIRVGDWVDDIDSIQTAVNALNNISIADVQTAMTNQGYTTARAAMIELAKKILVNKLELADGSVHNWILYDDDDATPLITWSVVDVNRHDVQQPVGAPSKRSRGV